MFGPCNLFHKIAIAKHLRSIFEHWGRFSDAGSEGKIFPIRKHFSCSNNKWIHWDYWRLLAVCLLVYAFGPPTKENRSRSNGKMKNRHVPLTRRNKAVTQFIVHIDAKGADYTMISATANIFQAVASICHRSFALFSRVLSFSPFSKKIPVEYCILISTHHTYFVFKMFALAMETMQTYIKLEVNWGRRAMKNEQCFGVSRIFYQPLAWLKWKVENSPPTRTNSDKPQVLPRHIGLSSSTTITTRVETFPDRIETRVAATNILTHAAEHIQREKTTIKRVWRFFREK